MTMTPSKAREIFELHKHQEKAIAADVKFNHFDEARYLYSEAKGFLNGIKYAQKEMDRLVEALEKIYQCEKSCCIEHKDPECRDYAEEALEAHGKWTKENK